VDTASAVDPNIRVNMRVHSSSRMSPDAPERKKQQRTTCGIGRVFLALRHKFFDLPTGDDS
jgi:hypothetical protein